MEVLWRGTMESVTEESAAIEMDDEVCLHLMKFTRKSPQDGELVVTEKLTGVGT